MKFLPLLSAALLVVITGCGDSSKSKTPSGGNTNAGSDTASPLTAPVDYLDSINKGQRSAERTVDTASDHRDVHAFADLPYQIESQGLYGRPCQASRDVATQF